MLFAGAYQQRKIQLFDTDSVGFQNDNTAQNAQHSSPLIAGCVTNNPGRQLAMLRWASASAA